MKSKRFTTKCISMLLTLALVLSILPVTAFAGEPQPWANDAVSKLNTVYGANTFIADNDSVTVEAAKTLLINKFSYAADSEIITNYLSTGTNLTRLQLAQVVCSLYGLTVDQSAAEFTAAAFSDCDDSAVKTLRILGIVAGRPDGTFAPSGEVTNAELAVIFYRALGKIGAAGDTGSASIMPGKYGYEELMYLITRGVGVHQDDSLTQDIGPATVRIWNINQNNSDPDDDWISYNGKNNILNAWCSRLAVLPPESGRSSVNWSVYEAVYNDTSLLDAIVLTVAEDKNWLVSDGKGDQTGIFSDVNPEQWFYDGVMYLFNNRVVSGYGDGKFGPNNTLTRDQQAALMCRIKNIDTSSPAGGVVVSDMATDYWSYNAVTHAIDRGYMTYTDGTKFNPNRALTRQEAALAIFKSYNQYNAENVNLSVLDRFTDRASIGAEYKTAMAYLVSAGVITGTPDGLVLPEAEINRATFGVLLSRVMMGLDKSRMYDYESAVTEVLQ